MGLLFRAFVALTRADDARAVFWMVAVRHLSDVLSRDELPTVAWATLALLSGTAQFGGR